MKEALAHVNAMLNDAGHPVRRSVRRHVGAVLALAAGLALGAPAQANADVDARIAAGEIVLSTRDVAGCELPEVTLQAVIDAPPAAVWKIIDDCAGYKRTMLRIIESRELSRAGQVSRCQVTVEMPMPMSNMTSLSEAVSVPGPATWRRSWKLVSGDYKRNEGSWTLASFDAEGKRTRVVYKVLAEPNVSVPNFIIRRAQHSALPDMMRKIRALATGK